MINWSEGAPYDRLREDGTEADTHLPGVPAKGVRVMGGGEEMHFTRPVVAGTVVTRRTVLLDVNERETRARDRCSSRATPMNISTRPARSYCAACARCCCDREWTP